MLCQVQLRHRISSYVLSSKVMSRLFLQWSKMLLLENFDSLNHTSERLSFIGNFNGGLYLKKQGLVAADDLLALTDKQRGQAAFCEDIRDREKEQQLSSPTDRECLFSSFKTSLCSTVSRRVFTEGQGIETQLLKSNPILLCQKILISTQKTMLSRQENKQSINVKVLKKLIPQKCRCSSREELSELKFFRILNDSSRKKSWNFKN